MFTSGTAGSSVAAMLSHGNVLANLAQIHSSGPDRLSAADVVYGVLPLNHIMGLTVSLLLTLDTGASVVMVQRFDPVTALDTVRERGSPSSRVLPRCGWPGPFPAEQLAPLRNVRIATTGVPSCCPRRSPDALAERCGSCCVRGTGSPRPRPWSPRPRASNPASARSARWCRTSSCGSSTPMAQTCSRATPARSGCRAPTSSSATGTTPRRPRALTEDGWLRTGDVAVSDDDGYLWLVDRAKDLIIVSGFNVFPAEVEEVIAELPGVAEVAVVGVSHPTRVRR